ncbi:hypothetical protein AI3042V1_1802 [Klebsiella pneumoniae]|jgi:uncharacterized protein YneF (UPF0154 family)|uniref:Uncharacterized protein n=1 Tax=Klebsiella pneumoniae TaxID=573 RepID=A0A486NPA5_KLEPN|nr:hypothetical protein AE80_02520 [Klebsiella pneumoniae CHS 24]KDL72734.1 hypothetical protein AD95_01042 [Klebsiella pneumoniae MGH 69]KLY97930.1 hypothetical protein SL05_02457 [Klebsiella pneumoniae]QBA59892.1 hypothetical protein Kp711_1827 [Klebsiella pneumoniae subsp. pneumoniae]KMF06901.1 hypothetical protein SM19_02283 [Klebsiella pneumoniae]
MEYILLTLASLVVGFISGVLVNRKLSSVR